MKPVEGCPLCGSTLISPIMCGDDRCPHRGRCGSYQNSSMLSCGACGWVEGCLRLEKTLLEASRKAVKTSPRGMGRQLSRLKTRLSRSEVSVIRLLEEKGVFSVEKGLTRNQVWGVYKDMYPQLRYPNSHSVTAWLSSLLGCGFLKMAYGSVELVNRETMRMRPRRTPVWWLSEAYQSGDLGFEESTRRIIRKR